ncbi:MAG: hypothetical protein IJ723_07145, partial [Ruminococcus sp.]|nr:hypothetical protein [Ruminococcus sp.]
ARLNERIKQLEREIKLRQQLSDEETAAQMVKGSIDRALGGQNTAPKPAAAAQPARTAPAPAPAAAQAARTVTAPAQTAPRVTPPLSERGAAGIPPKTDK